MQAESKKLQEVWVARMAALQRRERRRGERPRGALLRRIMLLSNLWTVLSLLCPGVSHCSNCLDLRLFFVKKYLSNVLQFSDGAFRKIVKRNPGYGTTRSGNYVRRLVNHRLRGLSVLLEPIDHVCSDRASNAVWEH